MFTQSQSKTKPLAVENIGNDKYIIRQNIIKADDNGNTMYTYNEKIITKDALDVMQCVEGVELKREANIIDEYTQQLMEEGTL